MSVHTGEKLTEKNNFFRRNLFIILSFLIPCAIMATVFALRQYFPFGNRMVMVMDSWHQYYPFLVEYQRMLKEGTSLMYSWNTGGGSSFLGVIANYLGSPLYLLSYFVPSGEPWLAAFLTLTVAIRIGCAGGFCAVFLRKTFRRHDLSLVYFSLMYAFCAFILGYYWNLMWLDSVALLPLVAAGVVGVLRDKQYALYIISLALSVIFSFYIGYFICLFVLLMSVCYTIISFVSFKDSLKNAGKMVLLSLVAFMLTAFITVPAYMALSASDSASDTSGFPLEYTVNYGFGLNGNGIKETILAIAKTVTNLLAYTKPITVTTGNPNIACGVLALVLICFYIFAKNIRLKEKIVSISLLGFFVLSFVINQLNYIWHGMNTPAMVYFRWSFIFSFVMVIMAYRVFTQIDSFTKKTFIFAFTLLVLYLGAAFFLQRKISVAVTAVAAVVIIAGFALYRAGKINYQLMSLLLCLFVICEMSLSAYYGTKVVQYSTNDTYPINKSEVIELDSLTKTLSAENEVYRTEFTEYYTLNDGALYSMYGVSTFNSMVDSSYGDFLAELGLAASKINNRYAYYETTPVANLFLNVKYLIARNGKTAVDTAHFKEIAATDNCTLYENTAYVPMGFMADTTLLDYELHSKWNSPAENQNFLFSNATGIDKDVLIEVQPADELKCDEFDSLTLQEGYTHYYEAEFKENKATEDEVPLIMTVEYEIEEDGNYYGLFRSTSKDNVTVIRNDDRDNALKLNESYTYIAALGNYKQGDRITVEMEANPEKTTRLAYYLYRIDDQVLQEGLDILRADTMTPSEWTDRGIKGSINAQEDGLFFTSVFYTEGWHAYVDGEEVEITPVGDTYVAFEISEGEHTVELKFTTPGIYLGAGVTILAVVLFILMGVALRNYRKKHPVTEEEPAENVDISQTTDESEASADSSCDTDKSEDQDANCTDKTQ